MSQENAKDSPLTRVSTEKEFRQGTKAYIYPFIAFLLIFG
jgi:hypothetical protein